jgi:hypothetical protein
VDDSQARARSTVARAFPGRISDRCRQGYWPT